MFDGLLVFSIPPWWQFVLEVFGDAAIDKYGRDDLQDVFLAITHVSLAKACK